MYVQKANSGDGDADKSNSYPPKMNKDDSSEDSHIIPENERNSLSEVEFQASKIIERLEAGTGGGDRAPPDSWSKPTGFLVADRKSPSELLGLIEDVIFSSDQEDESAPWPLPYLDEVGRLAVISHSISAYLTSLERSHLQRINSRLNADTTRWLSHLFRFMDCSAAFYDDSTEGLIQAVRLALVGRCPGYLESGGGSNGAPCLYASEASPLGALQHACRQIGLPLGCVRPVPVNTVFGSTQTMDLSALARMMSEDQSHGLAPLLVVGEVGTALCGHNDGVVRLQELCLQHRVWLHLRGHGLAALAVVQGSGVPTRIADSITLPLGTWLGIPGLPVVSLYRLPDPGSALTYIQTRRLGALPLWMTLQGLGRDCVSSRLLQAFHSCRILWESLSKQQGIRILSKEPGGEGGVYSMADIVSKPVNHTILFEAAISCVVFQFIGSQNTPSPSLGNKDSVNAPDEQETEPPLRDPAPLPKTGKVPAYYDELNSWLRQILQRDAPQVPLEMCELENAGVVLRFCPLEAPPGGPPEPRDLEDFSACLEQQLDILEATLLHKETFVKLVERSPVLKMVNLPGWAGLGGVRYVPEGWESLLTDQAKEELNKLNGALVESLRATDGAFSQGEGVDGLVCVRFGMVTADTDVEELLGLVVTVGRTVQESSRVMDSMTEIVKKGIEAATLELQRETEEKLWQEGILRHVPVVGRVVNWWSPPSKEGGVKGRSLNLTQGVVESTENIYRYHMQIAGGSAPISGSKGPPTPLVQTPVGPPSDVGHSRTSSHSSLASSKTPSNTSFAQNEAPSPKQ